MASDIKIAINVMKEIALSGVDRPIAERQRAIDALTLFHESALAALEEIARKVDHKTLKDRAELYVQRMKAGATTNFGI